MTFCSDTLSEIKTTEIYTNIQDDQHPCLFEMGICQPQVGGSQRPKNLLEFPLGWSGHFIEVHVRSSFYGTGTDKPLVPIQVAVDKYKNAYNGLF